MAKILDIWYIYFAGVHLFVQICHSMKVPIQQYVQIYYTKLNMLINATELQKARATV